MLFFAGSSATAAGTNGKKGQITLRSETEVGDLVLKPGTYRVQHRVEGSDHVIHFEALTKGNPYYSTVAGVKGHPGEIKCRLEPLSGKVRHTAVYTRKDGDIYRVTKVEIGGESVAHLL